MSCAPGDDDRIEEVSTDDGREDDGREDTDLHAAVAGQLAGATSQIAEQLSMITEEMNKLRGELYSDNGLGNIRAELDALRSGGGLEQIQQQVEQIEAGTTGSRDRTTRTHGRPAASSSASARSPHSRGAALPDRTDRGVSFSPDTRDVARRHGDGKAAMAPRRSSRRQQELRGGAATGGSRSWVPYLVVLVLVCVGPARPLIRQAVAVLWPVTDEPTPWYDAPYED